MASIMETKKAIKTNPTCKTIMAWVAACTSSNPTMRVVVAAPIMAVGTLSPMVTIQVTTITGVSNHNTIILSNNNKGEKVSKTINKCSLNNPTANSITRTIITMIMINPTTMKVMTIMASIIMRSIVQPVELLLRRVSLNSNRSLQSSTIKRKRKTKNMKTRIVPHIHNLSITQMINSNNRTPPLILKSP